MRSFKTLIIISLIFSNSCFADKAIEMKENDKAPFAGVLMDPEMANSVKSGLLERDLYKEITESQAHSIDLLKQNNTYEEEKVQKLLTQNDLLSERLQSAQSMSTFEKVGLFVLGVAVTIGAGIMVRNVSK